MLEAEYINYLYRYATLDKKTEEMLERMWREIDEEDEEDVETGAAD